ncbi:hypothetical protein [Sulfurimonas sp. NW9]|uniref:hypothetical protein n=1 Tax=Sulfurimonas sp. NW9 TaxID=2922728 RepID=UPI003DA7F67C
MADMPQFKSVEEMKRASSLIKEALKLLYQLKKETGETLKKLRQHQDFLGVTAAMTNNKFDITS